MTGELLDVTERGLKVWRLELTAWKSAGWRVTLEVEGRGEVRAGNEAKTSLCEKEGGK